MGLSAGDIQPNQQPVGLPPPPSPLSTCQPWCVQRPSPFWRARSCRQGRFGTNPVSLGHPVGSAAHARYAPTPCLRSRFADAANKWWVNRIPGTYPPRRSQS
jgi:hypothetical protein